MSISIDLHCDSVRFLATGADLRNPNPAGHVDLPRLQKGNVGVQVFAAYIPPATPETTAFASACTRLNQIGQFAASDPRLTLVETAEDCLKTMEEGKIGILKAVENGWAIENSLANLEKLRDQKVRIMTLVHSKHTSWAASCTGTDPFPSGRENADPKGGGLSSFGLQVVEVMNELGMIVDISHAAESAFWDALKHSKKPIIASHSCVHALCQAPRNLKDDQIKAIADCGGVIGVCFFPGFLNEAYRKAEDDCDDIWKEIKDIDKKYAVDSPQLRIEHDRINTLLEARLKHIVVPLSIIADHIDYIVKLGGEDCVSLGSDFDGIFSLPVGMSGCDCYPLLEEELKKRSYADKSMKKFFSANFLRVLREYD